MNASKTSLGLDRRTVLQLAGMLATGSLLGVTTGCATSKRTRSDRFIKLYTHGAIASDSPHATDVGISILKAGGNAIDAAIAVNAALGVVRPYSCGLGGGGFLVTSKARGEDAFAINARETAPAGIWETYYVDLISSGGPSWASRYGGHAAAVPGTPNGLFLAHRNGATMPMSQLLAPAARLAREGFSVDANYLAAVARVGSLRSKHPLTVEFSTWVWETLCASGNLELGNLIRNPALGNTLERLGEEGIAAWRSGSIPKSIARTARASGGKLTEQDIAGYRARKTKPLLIENVFQGDSLLTMPPPSSGGIAIAQILIMLEARLADFGTPLIDDPAFAHLLLEAMKIAFAQRAQYLADPKFAPVPVEALLSRERIIALAEQIDATRARSAKEVGTATQLPDDGGTSHFSIIDADGRAVAWTSTINGIFGSMCGDPNTGVILNNEMDDFTTQPGQANLYGLHQSDWNLPQPGKQPLSSMSPSILFDNAGDVCAIAGASGGPRIISSTLQVLLAMRYGELDAARAISRDRIHHQWMPDRVRHERLGAASDVRQQLKALGHPIEAPETTTTIGVVQAIRVSGRAADPAADPRKGGSAAGLSQPPQP